MFGDSLLQIFLVQRLLKCKEKLLIKRINFLIFDFDSQKSRFCYMIHGCCQKMHFFTNEILEFFTSVFLYQRCFIQFRHKKRSIAKRSKLADKKEAIFFLPSILCLTNVESNLHSKDKQRRFFWKLGLETTKKIQIQTLAYRLNLLSKSFETDQHKKKLIKKHNSENKIY